MLDRDGAWGILTEFTRSDSLYRGAEELGVDLDAHIGFVVEALSAAAPRVGLG